MILCALCNRGPVAFLCFTCEACDGEQEWYNDVTKKYEELPECEACDGEGSITGGMTCMCPVRPAGVHPEDFGRWSRDDIIEWLQEWAEKHNYGIKPDHVVMG